MSKKRNLPKEVSSGVFRTVSEYELAFGAQIPKHAIMRKRHKYGAKKKVVDGETFDSGLEHYFKQLLDYNKIQYKMKLPFLLQDEFTYNDEKIKAITIIPDFCIYDNAKERMIAIVDTKGITGYRKTKSGRKPIIGTPEFRLKWKMLKSLLYESKSKVLVNMFTPHSKSECHVVINKLIELLK